MASVVEKFCALISVIEYMQKITTRVLKQVNIYKQAFYCKGVHNNQVS